MEISREGFPTNDIFAEVMDTLERTCPELYNMPELGASLSPDQALRELRALGQDVPMQGQRDIALEQMISSIIEKNYPLHKEWEYRV